MTIPMWCMVAGMFLPYIWALASLPFRLSQFGTVDFSHPREQADRMTATGHSVVGAQFNAWEALTLFSVANLIAFMAGLDADGNWALASMIWVGARIAHGIFYVANVPVLRVFGFSAGLGMSLWIVFQAAMVVA